ncbi:unnamed protein product [Mytilus edulis]|uniref:DNA 3'-5' helicase n=1 Tax=Mytilus edulis TaxID=6550 RepID=A0A8S3RXA9_MYTED|nr:unnamed protein product [Mytilus edulis]
MSSDIRIVFSTTALGMGIDVVACHTIILYVSPRSILDLVQEIGTEGRDNVNSVAILLHNSFRLRSVNKEVNTLKILKLCHMTVIVITPSAFLVQEIGTEGRDNVNSVAILLHNSFRLRSVNKEVNTLKILKRCHMTVIVITPSALSESEYV